MKLGLTRNCALRSIILANECGTGKTITYLLGIIALNRRLRDMQAKGKNVRFGAILVIVPANVLPQAFAEAHERFGSSLRLYSFYGSANTCKSDTRRKATIDTKGLQGRMQAWDAAEDKPEVSRLLTHGRTYVDLRKTGR